MVGAGAGISGPAQVPLGRSQDGRLIVALHTGSSDALPVLVVGCIHGTECAGIAIARTLERVSTDLDLWIVPDLNPDGYAAGTRQNARGVDLNRNWSSQWPGGGRPWDTYYPGPRPFSERETRIARHQHLDLVWAWGQSSRGGRAGGDGRALAPARRLDEGRSEAARARGREAGRARADEQRGRDAALLSTNTIETHLRHVFQKLGVRSRTELATKFPDFRDSSVPPAS